IADNALLGAYAAAVPTVTSHIVLEVCRDFDLGAADVSEELTTPAPVARSSGQLNAFEKHVMDSVPLSALPLHARHTGQGETQSETDTGTERGSNERLATAPAPLLGALGTHE